MSNPRSIGNLLPPSVAKKLQDGYLLRPDLHGLNDREVYKTLKTEGRTPTPHDNRTRLKFWLEYDEAQFDMRKMSVNRIIAGIMTYEHFMSSYMSKPEKASWILCMPASYSAVATEALHFGMDKLRDILEMDDTDAKGRPNVKLLELKTKIIAMLDVRVNGAITQKIEQKTLSVHVNSDERQVKKTLQNLSMDELKARLKAIEEKSKPTQLAVRFANSGQGAEKF